MDVYSNLSSLQDIYKIVENNINNEIFLEYQGMICSYGNLLEEFVKEKNTEEDLIIHITSNNYIMKITFMFGEYVKYYVFYQDSGDDGIDGIITNDKYEILTSMDIYSYDNIEDIRNLEYINLNYIFPNFSVLNDLNKFYIDNIYKYHILHYMTVYGTAENKEYFADTNIYYDIFTLYKKNSDGYEIYVDDYRIHNLIIDLVEYRKILM